MIQYNTVFYMKYCCNLQRSTTLENWPHTVTRVIALTLEAAAMLPEIEEI